MPGNYFDQFDAPSQPQAAPQGGRLFTLPASPHQRAEDARADEHLQMDQQRLEMERQRFQQEQQTWHTQNDPVAAPGNATKTGEEYLATLPTALANQVRMMADGRMAMPAGAGQRSPQMRQLMAAAAQYDPTMDAANVATRIATRKDFTSGKSAQGITAINTALGHAGSLWQAAQALDNRSMPAWNSAANWAESESGDPRVNNFNMARNAVVDELTRVFRGTGGSESDIQGWRDNLNSSQSPEQLRASMAKAVDLLQSRLNALGDQYNRGMARSSDPMTLLTPHAQAVFNALKQDGSGVVGSDNAPLPAIGHSGPQGSPPGSPPAGPGAGVSGPQGGAPNMAAPPPSPRAQTIATGATRDVFDPATAAGVDALVRAGRPASEAQAYANAQGYNQFDPAAYATDVGWYKAHPGYQGSFTNAHRSVPTTLSERVSASAPAAAVVGAANAVTAGYDDELGAGVKAALTGQDYATLRDDLNARKSILAQTHPMADAAGNLVGGAGAMALGAGAAARTAPAMIGMFGRFAPVAGDAAYGAAYGSGQSNDDRLGGAVWGGLTGAAGGAAVRSATRGLANVIAPPAGAAAPLYEAGVYPTLGQRFANSGAVGKAVNTTEQAMQSFPVLGAMVARSRQAARDQFQRGAFGQALGDLGMQLPDPVGPGTAAHDYTSQAFNDAYSRARGGMQFVPDSQYLTDLGQFQQRVGNGVLNPTQADQVRAVIQNSVGGRLNPSLGHLTGDQYQLAGSELGDAAATWGKDGTTAPMANAVQDYLGIFDNAARRNSNPAAVDLLDNADSGYAKLVRIQNASARGGVRKDAGTFSPTDLAAAAKQEAGGVRSSAYNRGTALMQDYADAGKGLTDTLPNSGSAERLMTGQALAGGLGAAAHVPAAIASNPATLAPFALYAPGIDTSVKRMFAARQYTLPPSLSTPLIDMASQIYNRAPVVGQLATPMIVNQAVSR